MMKVSESVLCCSWFLAGPTASGKSAVAMELAELINAEIISLDSMTIYRGMDIGTAKPSVADRARVFHHLIDIADPHQDFSVAEFLRQAARAAEQVCGRERVPLFVGGTGLYLRSLLRGLCEAPTADWGLRRRLEQQASEFGPAWLHERLRLLDPPAAARLHPQDMRRIIRAIEVFELTGTPISADQTQRPLPPHLRPRCVWLSPPRPWLRERINQRVDAMLQAGWLDEARWLMNLSPPAGRTAMQALGYRELAAHLQGQLTLAAAGELIKSSTRQFAKRQHTWFRSLEECQELPIAGDESPGQLARRIMTLTPPSG
jgi:tRNA dimethylallyltransferase